MAKNKKTKVWFTKGTWYEIESMYNDLLKNTNVKIISTAITQDFEKHGNLEQFIFVVTYNLYS